MFSSSPYPEARKVIKLDNSDRVLAIREVSFSDCGNGYRKATVCYSDDYPPLIGGRFPVRKGSLECLCLEDEINEILEDEINEILKEKPNLKSFLSPELNFALKKIEEGIIFLECVV